MLIENEEVVTDAPLCLCNVVLNTEKTSPTLIYDKKTGYYLMYCKKCGFKTNSSQNKQSVITDWFYSNRSGDAHIKTRWIQRYNQQQGTAITSGGTSPSKGE